MKHKTQAEQVQVAIPPEIAQNQHLSDSAKFLYAALLHLMIDNMNKRINYSQKYQGRYIKLSDKQVGQLVNFKPATAMAALKELIQAQLVETHVAYANFKYIFLPGCEKFIEKE